MGEWHRKIRFMQICCEKDRIFALDADGIIWTNGGPVGEVFVDDYWVKIVGPSYVMKDKTVDPEKVIKEMSK